MKNITILGSTGSIGTSTLDVVRRFNRRFRVVGLTCDSNIELFLKQIKLFKPKVAAVGDESKFDILKRKLKSANVKLLKGIEGIAEVGVYDKSHIAVMAIAGSSALKPLFEIVKRSKRVALANKESLVMAGKLITSLARKNNCELIPVDSEHSAIFQCINSSQGETKSIRRLIITGSGGPFHSISRNRLFKVKPHDALKHPKWKMGRKITIDSATLMNKGLEVIEAHWLFEVDTSKIEVLIHPEAIIHSMVEYIDGSIIAQLGATDMRLPIQYALTYPNRLTSNRNFLDLAKIEKFNFKKPSFDKFPCLKLAYEVLKRGGTAPAVLNGANEELVHAFLRGEIAFYDIPEYIRDILKSHQVIKNPSINDILNADMLAKKKVNALLKRKG